jgi:hypothetical protein
VRREHSVKSRQVYSRRRHEHRQPGDEIQGLQHDVRRSVSIRGLKPVTDLPLRREIEPLDGHRRAAHVAGESFELLPLLGLYANPRVQRKPRVLRDTFPRLVRSRRHGL